MRSSESAEDYEFLLAGRAGSSAERALALSRCTNAQLMSLLTREVREINARIHRTKARLDSQALSIVMLQFSIALVGFFTAFALSISPYFSVTTTHIPQVISYLSAFVVVLFGYFAVTLYREFIAGRRLREEVKFVLKDGLRTLKEAEEAYAQFRKELDEPGDDAALDR